jgi:hypothetical protein
MAPNSVFTLPVLLVDDEPQLLHSVAWCCVPPV